MSNLKQRGARVEFADITPDRKGFPSWVVKHGRGAAVTMPRPVDLRPAHLPRDLAALEEEIVKDTPPPPVPSPPPDEPVSPPEVPSVPEPEPREVVRYEIDEQATNEVRAAARELLAAREWILRESELEVVKLAEVIARKVIARELAMDPKIVEGLVREGLSALTQPDRVTVRVGVGFAAASNDLLSAFAHEGPELRVVVDDKLDLYGCVIEASLGRVDESIETRMATLLSTLLGDAGERAERDR